MCNSDDRSSGTETTAVEIPPKSYRERKHSGKVISRRFTRVIVKILLGIGGERENREFMMGEGRLESVSVWLEGIINQQIFYLKTELILSNHWHGDILKTITLKEVDNFFNQHCQEGMCAFSKKEKSSSIIMTLSIHFSSGNKRIKSLREFLSLSFSLPRPPSHPISSSTS